MMKLPTDRTVFQNAWVVDDFEAAAMKWVNLFNIGPFFYGEYGPGDIVDVSYRGQPGEIHMLAGLAQAGPIQIELIQPLTEGPICYRDTVNLDADLNYYNEKGCATANRGTVAVPDLGFAYVDTHAELGCMIEIIERNKMVEEMFKMIADSGENWDGKDPIRSL
jgi:hypothetical protein